MTYTTNDIAKEFGVHPNTVRLYEKLGLISPPERTSSGYRIFHSLHFKQFQLARLAFQIEVLQNGLRKLIVEVVKLSASKKYDEASIKLSHYVARVEEEIENAKQAAALTSVILHQKADLKENLRTRKQVSSELNIGIDTIRNWEMNGLIVVRRKQNGYRVYDDSDMNEIRIIRSLRCANYSLTAILRMMNEFRKQNKVDVLEALNQTRPEEEIISVCDHLIESLHLAKENAVKIEIILTDLNKI